jgi:Ca-activated chloride channel family protein
MKTQRTQSAQQSTFGLVAWLEQTRVALPLKGVECQFQVTGDIASVQLDQVYHQNANRPLDCTYTFPLPAGAAVYRCEVHINGRIIRAKVEEEAAAREIYRTQKAAGRRTALVETERENVFTLSLGNVQPGDVIVVCFAWFQALDRLGNGLRLMVPTCPGVRYIPGKPLLRALSGRGTVDDTDQVPDASRITPPRINALHPDAAYLFIKGMLSASDVESGSASSPSHPILVREIEGQVIVELPGRDTVPDRDFVVTWQEPKVLQLTPQAWHWKEGEETYALVQLRAPENVKVADGLSQDFYFLVDRSGSMEGAKWVRTCEALRGFVGLLGATDRVWITLFESEFQDFDAVPVPAPDVLKDTGFQQMQSIGTDGGTELLPAAHHVLEAIAAHSAGRRTNVILITDGEVGNDEEILQAFKKAGRLTVHTFGIDTAVNDAFLKALARQHRGGCWLQTPDDDIAGTVAALGDRLRRPVLSQLSLDGSWESADGALPDLHAKEVVTVALRGLGKGPVQLSGYLPDGTEHAYTLPLGNEGSEAVKLLWVRQRISSLIESGKQNVAIALAKMHNLICEGAAFIAWDEEEQVAVAKDELVQPALEQKLSEATALYAKTPSILYAGSTTPVAKSMTRLRFSRAADDDTTPPLMARRSTLANPPHDSSKDVDTFTLDEEAKHKAFLEEKFQRMLRGGNIPEAVAEQLHLWTNNGTDYARVDALLKALDFIGKIRRALGEHSILEEILRGLFAGPVEELVKWRDENLRGFNALMKLRDELRAIHVPGEMIERLIVRMVERRGFDQGRIEVLRKMIRNYKHRLFSARARLRLLNDLENQLHSEALR